MTRRPPAPEYDRTSSPQAIAVSRGIHALARRERAARVADCADLTCRKCAACYSEYVQAKVAGELDR